MSNLITLKSPGGQVLLEEVRNGGGLIQPILIAVFCKQSKNPTCGIQSTALLLAAEDEGKKMPSVLCKDAVKIDSENLKYTEEKMFTFSETLAVADLAKVRAMDGLTLDQKYDILKRHRPNAVKYHTDESSVEAFCKHAKESLKQTNSGSGISINYHMQTLGQVPGFGHHSPLGAYHEASDRFLVLDTWYETEECWATTNDIYAAMNTVDSASEKRRGYCVL